MADNIFREGLRISHAQGNVAVSSQKGTFQTDHRFPLLLLDSEGRGVSEASCKGGTASFTVESLLLSQSSMALKLLGYRSDETIRQIFEYSKGSLYYADLVMSIENLGYLQTDHQYALLWRVLEHGIAQFEAKRTAN